MLDTVRLLALQPRKRACDRVQPLLATHQLRPPLRSPSPVKPDHLERHPLRLDLWIAQDRSADATKALGLETRLSHRTCRARLLPVGPSDFLLSILGYPRLISSCSTDMLVSLVAFAPTVSCRLLIQLPSYLVSANYNPSCSPRGLSPAGLTSYFSSFSSFSVYCSSRVLVYKSARACPVRESNHHPSNLEDDLPPFSFPLNSRSGLLTNLIQYDFQTWPVGTRADVHTMCRAENKSTLTKHDKSFESLEFGWCAQLAGVQHKFSSTYFSCSIWD